ncbi:MAG TPA: low temperature requirement protein A [Vicinamibacteria bacterium]
MSHLQPHHAHHHRPWIAPLGPRSPEEEHRASTPLELFFDLVIVVAVAQAASGLHHALSEGHPGEGVLKYSMVFFGVWWAWVNFTWFASAYDNDDVIYRLLVLLQMTGALVFAAGIPSFVQGDLALGVVGYVLMRLSLVSLWLRAAKADPPRRSSARRYAEGVLLVQLAWVVLLFAPREVGFVGFWALALCELVVPAWAERAAQTTWHPEHIGERYGLFTLITLGESILAASVALRSAKEAGASALGLLPIVVGGLLIVFSCWWLYFERPAHELLKSRRNAFLWGYGHYFVFASAAAVGAGLAVCLDHATHHAPISARAAGAAVAVPVAVFLACLWFLHGRAEPSVSSRVLAPLVVAAVLLTPFTGQAVLGSGLLMAGLVAFKIVEARGQPGLVQAGQ